VKKTGRPPLDAADASVSVSTRMPSRQYDEMARRAKDARVSVAEQLRRDVAAASGFVLKSRRRG
jgi:hypothetical protein